MRLTQSALSQSLSQARSHAMTSKLSRLFLAVAVSLMLASAAFAQTDGTKPASSAGNLPAAPSTALNSTPASAAADLPKSAVTKVATINVEQAVFASNEGQRDFEALRKKLEPKQNELKSQNDELEALQKQLQTQGDKLNEDARASLVKQIETKKKSFDRSVQDAQEDAQNQQKDMFQRILQKMAPVIIKLAQDNGYAMIVDTSNPWPQGPVLWVDPEKADITKAVVDAYNVQSGVPAPAAAPATPKPATPKAPATKPATPPANQQQPK